jgi:hypothetical protein
MGNIYGRSVDDFHLSRPLPAAVPVSGGTWPDEGVYHQVLPDSAPQRTRPFSVNHPDPALLAPERFLQETVDQGNSFINGQAVKVKFVRYFFRHVLSVL